MAREQEPALQEARKRVESTHRFQISLRSLLLSQVLAGLILLLNMYWPGYWGGGWHYFGWPFKSFRDLANFKWFEIADWDALYANILVWITLILFPIFLPTVISRIRNRRSLLPEKFELAAMIATGLLVLQLTVLKYYWYELRGQTSGSYWSYVGWPFEFIDVHRDSPRNQLEIHITAWRYLALNLYAWMACLVVVWWFAKRIYSRLSSFKEGA